MTTLLKIMELVYVLLEAGNTIREFTLHGNHDVKIRVNTQTVLTTLNHIVNSDVYSILDEVRVVPASESMVYRAKFENSSQAHELKQVAIMKFVLRAMSSGWNVKKRTGTRQYAFNKTHHRNKKYLNGSFLSTFLKQNALR
jgi:hypothetical protein